MRRLSALLGKELRQHAVAGLALFLSFSGGYLLMLLGTLAGPQTISVMQAHAAFLVFIALGAMVLGNRLVVAEYYGRTQLFVEALPLSRWEAVALKYLLGLALLFLAAGLSLLLTATLALSREPIDARFLVIVAARTGSFVFFIWSFFFAMGFLGRFRIAIYGALLIALALVDEMTAFEFQHFGPFAVLDGTTLPFEREVLPLRAVLQTLAFGAGWTALAFALSLIHEGSVAETLARRMSQREKAVLGILFIVLSLAIAVLEERRDKKPYTFPEEEVLNSAILPLQVLYHLPERRGDAETLLKHLERDLEAFRLELGWPHLPPVRIAYGPSLDPGTYDPATLEENEGVLVRANFVQTEGWDPRDFSAYILGLVLDEVTTGRARFEPKAWLRDAFAHWWSVRGLATPEVDDTDPGLVQACHEGFQPVLRALWATRHDPLNEGRLAAWLRYREQYGEELAEAVALSGLLVLEQHHGRDAVLRLTRRVFARQPSEDLRELFYEWRHPMAEVFEEATSLAWPDWIATWNAELEQLRGEAPCRDALAGVPDGVATLDVEHGEGSVRNIIYSFHFAEPPPPGTLVTLLHSRLTPFDSPLERRDLRQVERLWPNAAHQATWSLPGFYNQGSRAFLALEVESTVLGCKTRLLAERRLMP